MMSRSVTVVSVKIPARGRCLSLQIFLMWGLGLEGTVSLTCGSAEACLCLSSCLLVTSWLSLLDVPASGAVEMGTLYPGYAGLFMGMRVLYEGY